MSGKVEAKTDQSIKEYYIQDKIKFKKTQSEEINSIYFQHQNYNKGPLLSVYNVFCWPKCYVI